MCAIYDIDYITCVRIDKIVDFVRFLTTLVIKALTLLGISTGTTISSTAKEEPGLE